MMSFSSELLNWDGSYSRRLEQQIPNRVSTPTRLLSQSTVSAETSVPLDASWKDLQAADQLNLSSTHDEATGRSMPLALPDSTNSVSLPNIVSPTVTPFDIPTSANNTGQRVNSVVTKTTFHSSFRSSFARIPLSETSSADAEGSDDNEEMYVDTMIRPSNPSPKRLQQSPDVSPSPSVYSPSEAPSSPPRSDYIVQRPSRTQRLRYRPREWKFSHVAVPPFPAGLGSRDYKRINLATVSGVKYAAPPMRGHNAVGDALSATWQHNESINSHHRPTRDSGVTSGSLKRKRRSQPDSQLPTRVEAEPGSGAWQEDTRGPSSTPGSDHPSWIPVPSESLFELSLEMMDPLNPPHCSHAALMSSIRHLLPDDYAPSPALDAVQGRSRRPRQWNMLFPGKPIPEEDDDITLGHIVREPSRPSDDVIGDLAKKVPPLPIANTKPHSRKKSQGSKNKGHLASTFLPLSAGSAADRVAHQTSLSPKHEHPTAKQPPLTMSPSAKMIGKRKVIERDESNPLQLNSVIRSGNDDERPFSGDIDPSIYQYLLDFGPDDGLDAAISSQFVAPPSLGQQVDDWPERAGDSQDIFHSSALDTSGDTPLANHASDEDLCREDLPTSPWFLTNDATMSNEPADAELPSGYGGNGTIDPSLLDGTVLESRPLAPSLSPSKSPPSSPVSRRHAPDSMIQRRAIPVSPSTVRGHTVSGRISRAPTRPDMIFTGDLELSSRSESDDDTEYSDSSRTKIKPKTPASPRKPLCIKLPAAKRESSSSETSSSEDDARKVSTRSPQRPLVGTRTSCHHCRRATTYPKMSCSSDDCPKKFCIICIRKRYPDISFNSRLSTFVCPACNNNCGCSICTRKRGEVYISRRSSAHQTKEETMTVKLGGRKAASVRRGCRKSTSEVPLDEPPKRDTRRRESRNVEFAKPKWIGPERRATMNTLWGTIYAPTGEKMGTGYIGDDGKDNVIRARVAAHFVDKIESGQQTIKITLRSSINNLRGEKAGTNDSGNGSDDAVRLEATQRVKARKKRVFIGTAQEWWNIGAVRDLDPVVTSRIKGKDKLFRISATRTYIGKKPPGRAHWPSGLSHLSRSPSPLTSAPESDNDTDGGGRQSIRCGEGLVDRTVDAVVSLGDEDVQRAIEAALGSLVCGSGDDLNNGMDGSLPQDCKP